MENSNNIESKEPSLSSVDKEPIQNGDSKKEDDGSVEQYASDGWEDILGTGAILKKIIEPGDRGDIDMEAPRRFFAFIDIETRLYKSHEIIKSESHKDFAVSVDSDLFPAVTIIIPLMNIGEVSQFILEPRFAYGDKGNLPDVPTDSALECTIRLISRFASDEYVDNHLRKMEPIQRLSIADRKRERGNFWFSRGEYQHAIESYKSSVVYLEDILAEDELVRFAVLGDLDQAKESAEIYIKRNIATSLISSKNNLAASYIKTNQCKKALAAVERALEINPNNIKSLYRKSTIESNTGKFDDAVITLTKILELEPSNKAAKLSYEKLSKKRRKQTEDERNMCKRMFTSEEKPVQGLGGGSRSSRGKHSGEGQSGNIAKYGVIGAALIAVTSAILYTQSSLISKYF